MLLEIFKDVSPARSIPHLLVHHHSLLIYTRASSSIFLLNPTTSLLYFPPITMKFSVAALTLASLASAAEMGWSGTIQTKDGGLGGVVSVVNDTTLMISKYTLKDASAPALYWWGATDSNLPKGFRINNMRVSEAAKTDTIMINLDAGHKASEFTYVGLWCEKLNANFGQAMLSKDGSSTAGSGSAPSASSTPDKKGAAAGLSSSQGALAALGASALAIAAFMA